MKALFSFLAAAALGVACQTVPAAAEPVAFDLVDEAHGGALYSTADHAGAPIVVEFYFNGCPACESNAAKVNDLARAHHRDGGAQVVEVSIDCDAGDYEDWVRRHAPVGPVLNGCDGELRRALGVSRFPTTVVLDRDHREVWRTVGVWSRSTTEHIARLVSGRR